MTANQAKIIYKVCQVPLFVTKKGGANKFDCFKVLLDKDDYSKVFLDIWKKQALFPKTVEGKQTAGIYFNKADILLIDTDLSKATESDVLPLKRKSKFDNFKRDQYLEIKHI